MRKETFGIVAIIALLAGFPIVLWLESIGISIGDILYVALGVMIVGGSILVIKRFKSTLMRIFVACWLVAAILMFFSSLN